METASYCVYNVTRNALLSERVISVSEPQTPSQLLALVMNGPGRDAHFCIRLTKPSVASDVPRLFAFDVAYLDCEQKILQVADVGPGTPFPDITDQVGTILFLSDQLLAKSNTEAGDFIRICTEAELAALLRATAQFQAVELSGWPIESRGPASTVAPDPFAGSLVYMPSSGTPQNTEIFLSSRVPQSTAAEVAPEEMSFQPVLEESAEPLDELNETGQVLVGSSHFEADETQLSQELDPLQSEQPDPPHADLPPLTHIFETAHQLVSPPDSPTVEAQPPDVSKRRQIPFSFKAVIQFVDDQLRREKVQQERSILPNAPEEISEPEVIQLAEPPALQEIEEPVSAVQLVSSAEPEKIAETFPDLSADEILELPDLSTEDILGLPEISTEDVLELPEIEAAATYEAQRQPVEDLSLPEITADEIETLQPLPEYPDPQPLVPLETLQEPEPVSKAAPVPLPIAAPEPAPVVATLPAPEPEILPAVARAEAPPSQVRFAPERPVRFGAKEKLPFAARVQRWLAGESVSLSGNRRRGERMELPGLVAFYFTGGAPKPHEIVNISNTGLYLRSKELWSPNTLVRMTLERQDADYGEKKSISVLARVVRVDEGGIGHEFVTNEVLKNLRARDFLPQQGTNRKELERFLADLK